MFCRYTYCRTTDEWLTAHIEVLHHHPRITMNERDHIVGENIVTRKTRAGTEKRGEKNETGNVNVSGMEQDENEKEKKDGRVAR